MAALALMALGAYALWNRPPPTSTVASSKPTNPLALPPIDKYNPAKNDMIRPQSWTYDPLLQIGYNSRVRAKPVKGPYPQEKYLSEESRSQPNPLWKGRRFTDAYIQQQDAYTPLPFILDPVYWNTGVQPPSRIRSAGDPTLYRVPAYSSSPYF